MVDAFYDFFYKIIDNKVTSLVVLCFCAAWAWGSYTYIVPEIFPNKAPIAENTPSSTDIDSQDTVPESWWEDQGDIISIEDSNNNIEGEKDTVSTWEDNWVTSENSSSTSPSSNIAKINPSSDSGKRDSPTAPQEPKEEPWLFWSLLEKIFPPKEEPKEALALETTQPVEEAPVVEKTQSEVLEEETPSQLKMMMKKKIIHL